VEGGIMRKLMNSLVVLFLLISLFNHNTTNAIEANDLTPNASASILIEASSKEVLLSKNEHELLYPASTTKIMTMILLFEEINKGTLKWEDVLTTSTYASSMGGSQIYLEPNERMTVEDLYKAIAIASANDACVVVGERIGGSIENFVKMMNEKAKELGLTDTNFTNCTGLHDDNHYTSAYDLSMMAAFLIEIGGERLLEVTSTFDTYIRQDTEESFWLVNTNKLLNYYEGVDGLKTGFTKESGYCIVTTAKREGLRFISVVLKEPDPSTRNQEASALLDYGFNQYEAYQLFAQGEEVTKLDVVNSRDREISLIAKQDIIIPIKKGTDFIENYHIDIIKALAPLNQGETIGYLHLIDEEGNMYASYELSIDHDVFPYTFLEYFEQTFNDILNK